MYTKLKALKTKIIMAEMELLEECRRVYPVGCIVHFKKGRGLIEAEVLDHRLFHTELWVKNINTGKEYRIGILGYNPVVVKAAPLKCAGDTAGARL